MNGAAMSTYRRFTTWTSAGADTDRSALFGDVFFAIAMVLVASTIRIPSVPVSDYAAALGAQFPEFVAYAVSFVLLSGFWLTHHRLFKLLTGYNNNLLRINLVVLLFVAMTPYATAVLARYGGQPSAVILYAAVFSGVGLGQVALLQYAWRRSLLTRTLGRPLFHFLRTRSLIVPAVFVTSIPVALFDPNAAMFLWIFVLVLDAALILDNRRQDEEDETPSRELAAHSPRHGIPVDRD
jgi:uncharacterized membrane protein